MRVAELIDILREFDNYLEVVIVNINGDDDVLLDVGDVEQEGDKVLIEVE
jgi:hypothetical protein